MPLQLRRGSEAERTSPTINLTLARGEPLWVENTKTLFIGDGTTPAKDLIPVSGFGVEEAQDAAQALFTTGTHSGIAFVYNDVDGKINATVDFSAVTEINAGAFKGSLFADDSTLLVDGVDATFNLDGTIKGDIVPNVTESYDLGSTASRFREIYLSGDGLFLGDARVSSLGSAIDLPPGSTVGGMEISTTTGQYVGDLVGSVFGDNSTMLVDGTNNTLSNGAIRLENNTISSFNGDEVIMYGNITASQLQVRFPTIAASTVNDDIFTASLSWKYIEIFSKKTSLTSVEDHVSGDVLGTLQIVGQQGSTLADMGSVIGAQVDPAGTTTSTHIPTKLFFTNTAATEAESLVEDKIMTFDSLGRLAINKQIAQATLDVEGYAKLAILTEEPDVDSDADGTIAIADGTLWDPSGGANVGKQQAVIYLAGAWVALATSA